MSGAARLYLITPPALEAQSFRPRLEAALDAGDVACVQLRLPGADRDAMRQVAAALRPVVQERGVAFLLRGHWGLAAELGADGVHVGTVAELADARAVLGQDGIVGVSTHASRHEAMLAAEGGADYVSFGSFFPSRTVYLQEEAPVEIVSWWAALMEVPQVAVGGLAPANCAPLVAAGADFIAASAAVWEDPAGPAAAVAAFGKVLAGG